jgi:radical SAM superfamily enzyme YgiQ (UPF0313 family)
MKILLISSNRESRPDPVAPIGLACLAGHLKREGFTVDVLDLCFVDDLSETIRRKKKAFQPDAIGLSIRNVDDTIYPGGLSYVPEIEEICLTIKEGFSGPVILGGSGFSLIAKGLMERVGIDLGIVGEGENALPRLLRALSNRREVDGIPGLCRRLPDGSIEIQKIEPTSDFAGLNSKGWENIDTLRYYRAGGMINIQTKRGCSFRCLYCTYPKIEGDLVRTRRPIDVVDEIQEWVDHHGVNQFYFVDSVFNYPLDHAASILDEICRRNLKIGWTAYINPRFVTRAFAGLMARSGCTGVELGVDSGSDRILTKLRKDFDSGDVSKAITLCRDEGLRCCVSMILGGPAEDSRSLHESFDFIDSIGVNAVIAMVGIRIYPGCGIHDLCLDEGRLREEDPLLEPTFYISSDLSEQEIVGIFRQARKRGNWIVPGDGINFDGNLFQRMRDKEVKGPLWRFVRKGGIPVG